MIALVTPPIAAPDSVPGRRDWLPGHTDRKGQRFGKHCSYADHLTPPYPFRPVGNHATPQLFKQAGRNGRDVRAKLFPAGNRLLCPSWHPHDIIIAGAQALQH